MGTQSPLIAHVVHYTTQTGSSIHQFYGRQRLGRFHLEVFWRKGVPQDFGEKVAGIWILVVENHLWDQLDEELPHVDFDSTFVFCLNDPPHFIIKFQFAFSFQPWHFT